MIKTGRKHQIRVHLYDLGNPVVGDERYARDKTKIPLALHAYYLAFPHSKTKQKMEFKTELPERLSVILSHGDCPGF
jgi:23S rRNA pseudouridine1911/1915/1917 synthase